MHCSGELVVRPKAASQHPSYIHPQNGDSYTEKPHHADLTCIVPHAFSSHTTTPISPTAIVIVRMLTAHSGLSNQRRAACSSTSRPENGTMGNGKGHRRYVPLRHEARSSQRYTHLIKSMLKNTYQQTLLLDLSLTQGTRHRFTPQPNSLRPNISGVPVATIRAKQGHARVWPAWCDIWLRGASSFAGGQDRRPPPASSGRAAVSTSWRDVSNTARRIA